MRIPFTLAMVLFTVYVTGQDVNKPIKLQLSQSTVLRVNAGDDINLDESGFAIIGESTSVSGGTPDFSYKWIDEVGSEFYEKSPEVSQTGRYWLTVTDQNNCLAIDSLSVLDYGTGLVHGTVYPEEHVVFDGVLGTIHIDISKVEGHVNISVLSVDGKVVYTFSGKVILNQFSHRVDLSTEEQGIYLLCIQLSNRKSVRKLFLH